MTVFDPESLSPVPRQPELFVSEWDDPVHLADVYDTYSSYLVRDRQPVKNYVGTPFDREVRDARSMVANGDFVRYPELMVHSMGQLAVHAETADLAHLRFGLFGYANVTEACRQRLYLPAGSEGSFDYPEKIRVTMPQFYDEFLKSAEHHNQGRPWAVGGWYGSMYSRAAREALPAIGMFDFLDGHVYYDLPVALFRTHTDPKKHKYDYDSNLNAILAEVASGIVDKYAQFSPPMRAMMIDKIGMKLALHELYDARNAAWQTFLNMRQSQDSADYASIRQHQRERVQDRTMSSKRTAGVIVRMATQVDLTRWDSEDKLIVDLSEWRRKHGQSVGQVVLGRAADPPLAM